MDLMVAVMFLPQLQTVSVSGFNGPVGASTVIFGGVFTTLKLLELDKPVGVYRPIVGLADTAALRTPFMIMLFLLGANDSTV
jgi:hypothetical protein